MFRLPTADQVIACFLAVPIIVLLGMLFVVVVSVQGRPFLYSSERMRSKRVSFRLHKIRTMHVAEDGLEERVLGGDAAGRVTKIGGFLRRTRLDELPQIFNVIRGDIGFIGPRPPLRRHVNARPDLFAPLLAQSRPGITGLATVLLHAREEQLLAACGDAEESENVYLRRCLPIKVRLDLIYARRSGLRLNLLILWYTFARLSKKRRGSHVKKEPVAQLPSFSNSEPARVA